tara:strand:+ start:1377 stop:2273 length:897 start_codon:yes stop_codon:yes gene_type:complete
MQNKNQLITIILNCYNGEKYLNEALRSVLSQSYKNWELIFWDNKSTDRSKKIFKSFKDKRLRYFYSNKHRPLYEAKNLAIKKSKGSYLAFIDADDFWEKNKLKEQIKLFSDKRVGVVYGNMWIRNEINKRSKLYWKTQLPGGMIYNKIIKNYCVGIISTMIRKKILNIHKNIFNLKYNHIGDFDLFIKLSRKHKFGVIQSPVATYRIHGKNLSFINRKNEIYELKDWFNNNKKKLKKDEKVFILKRIEQREFLNLKLKGEFLKTFRFLINKKSLRYKFKNLILLVLPTQLLKTILWYQ